MKDIELLCESAYFDKAYYRQKHPDIRKEGEADHYLTTGGFEGSNPSRYFSSIRYLSAYPDVAAAGINPLIHFIRSGMREQRWAGLLPPLIRNQSLVELDFDQQDIDTLVDTELFDPLWYRTNYGVSKNVGAEQHYLLRGASNGWSPGPTFNGLAYSRLYPDIGGMNPLLHYVRRGREEGRPPPLMDRFKLILERELPGLAELEPKLMTDDRLYSDLLGSLPSLFSMPRGPLAACWQRIWPQFDGSVRHLVFVPWLVRGGADLAACNVVKALQNRFTVDGVAIILTDHESMTASDWLPVGTRVIRLSTEDSHLSATDAREIVVRLIWSLRPDSVININSRACWDAYVNNGAALVKMSMLKALIFCDDFNRTSRRVGYANTHFRESVDYISSVYFDTRYFIREMIDRFGLPKDIAKKLKFLPQPAPRCGPIKQNLGALKPIVMWAGRFAEQKNIDLLIAIVKKAPDIHFDIWGSGDLELYGKLIALSREAGNASLRGPFSSLDDVDCDRYGAFLFTSRYEGLPTILLSIGARGLPIVATAVGGVTELVNQETGWAIASISDPDPYIEALRQVLELPDMTSKKNGSHE